MSRDGDQTNCDLGHNAPLTLVSILNFDGPHLVFIVSSLTLLALIIGLCQKVVGIILDIIAAFLHVGVLVYYILFVIKGSQYTVAMAGSSSLILQIVPCVSLALCTIACFVCMFDCCRHVYATRFSGSGSKGVSGTGDSSTDYVPLQGSKHIDSDSDDSD